MTEFILTVISCLIAIGGIVYCGLGLFTEKQPFYFRILFLAAGCYALGQVFALSSLYCGGFSDATLFSTGMLCYLGCACFMLCANRGALSKVVYEHKSPGAAYGSLIAPGVYMALVLILCIGLLPKDAPAAVTMFVFLTPGAFCCYLNLRHLLSPGDALELLRGIRGCDIFSLLYGLLLVIALLLKTNMPTGALLPMLLQVAVSLAMLGLCISAVKGAKQWGI